MNSFRIVQLLIRLSTLTLGVALMGGGAFLAGRSIKSAFWAAMGGFSVIVADLVRSWIPLLTIRAGIPVMYPFQLVSIVESIAVFGTLILAVRSLPSRTS